MNAELEKKRAASTSVWAAVLLTTLKLVVGIATGSLGILSEAAHSALDLVAALVTYFAVRFSDRPPDREHQYGHGKIEPPCRTQNRKSPHHSAGTRQNTPSSS